MTSRGLAKFSLVVTILVMVVSVVGFIVALVVNTFFLDDYDAYGEVPIPGSGSVNLPAGEVTISFHTVVIGSTNGGLPVPRLDLSITPPDGVAEPVVTESTGTSTTVNNDAHIRVWVAQIPSSGTYNVRTEGQVNGYIDPRLAFGHKSSIGFLVWLFVATFVAGLVGSILSGWWLARTRRKPVVTASPYFPPPFPQSVPVSPVVPTAAPRPPIAAAHEPGDEGVRLERLKTLAALRDSGALTQEEFEAEKHRILEGH